MKMIIPINNISIVRCLPFKSKQEKAFLNKKGYVEWWCIRHINCLYLRISWLMVSWLAFHNLYILPEGHDFLVVRNSELLSGIESKSVCFEAVHIAFVNSVHVFEKFASSDEKFLVWKIRKIMFTRLFQLVIIFALSMSWTDSAKRNCN